MRTYSYLGRRLIVVAALAPLLACADITAPVETTDATGERADANVPKGSGPFALNTSLDLGSIQVGEQRVVQVFAEDVGLGTSVPFTASTSGSCVSIAVTATDITVTGLDVQCEQDIVITAEDQSKTIVFKGYDPFVMDIGDGLLMKYVTLSPADFRGWADDGTFWLPAAADGWYPVGAHIQWGLPSTEAIKTVPMILLHDASPQSDILGIPAGFVPLPFGDGTGLVYWPTCQPGYAALGVAIVPDQNSIRCVSEDHLVPGSWRGFSDDGEIVSVWQSSDDLQNRLSAWMVGPSPLPMVLPEGVVPMWTRSHIVCRGDGDINTCPLLPDVKPYQLKVTLPVMEKTDDQRTPRLVGPTTLQIEGARFGSTVRMPFTLLPSMDPTCGSDVCGAAWSLVPSNVHASPFWRVSRVEVYEAARYSLTNNTSQPATLSWTHTNGFNKTKTEGWSRSIGFEVTIEGKVGFLGTGTKVSASLSGNFEWNSSTARSYSLDVTVTREATVAPGTTVSFVQVQSEFVATREDGALTFGWPERMGENRVVALEWRPEQK